MESLLWARPIPRPSFIPAPARQRGARAAGLRYERRLASYLGPSAVHGQWFEFEDQFGVQYCQTDILLSLLPRCVAVIEAKYTLVPEAFDQLTDLYLPIVSAAYRSHVGLVAVFKNFPPATPDLLLHEDLAEAAKWSADTGQVALVQWVGQPILASPNPRTHSIISRIRARVA